MSTNLMDDLEDRPRKRKRKGISVFTVLGLLLMLGGLGALGYVGWEYFGTNITSQQAFDQQKSGLRAEWDKNPAATNNQPGTKGQNGQPQAQPEKRIPGSAIALMRIPKLGKDYEVPIMTGTDAGTLAKGLGWYENSVHAGQIGNFAVAGHRVTHGEPFKRILELKKGDEVVVETREAIYTYVMDTSPADLTVDDSETWVLDPVPGKPGAQPTQPIITLTTCQDLFHSADRSIGFGHLASTKNK
ncbi:class E sortase [Mariniluteicoccus endophyticus]